MSEGPSIVRVAALIGERGRAEILGALLAGQALTATELADAAGITRPTASSHLARLVDARLIEVEKQGRHRYFRLAGPHVGQMLEGLLVVAADAAPAPLQVGPKDAALRRARVCYDHLAGELGVAIFEQLRQRQLMIATRDDLVLSDLGRQAFARLGIDVRKLEVMRRPLCRACLDWSERRHHLAGALGAALLARMFELKWARRVRHSRVIDVAARGERALRSAFG